MSTLVMIDNAIAQFECHLDELPRVSAAKIGLDGRAGYVYVDVEDQCIIAANPSSLDYYGGFEYVSEEAVYRLGTYKIYSSESERVQTAIDYFEQHHSEIA